MTDPWMVQNSGQENHTVENGVKENCAHHEQSEEFSLQPPLEFEDNFEPTPALTRTVLTATPNRRENNSNSNVGYLEPLPDSDNYLRGLERKLQKIKKGSNLVEALAEKRNDCLRQLLNNGDPDNNNAVLALDEPLSNLEFCRHLQPVQALSVGELVHIVKYDHLQQEEQQDIVEKNKEIENKIEKGEKEE